MWASVSMSLNLRVIKKWEIDAARLVLPVFYTYIRNKTEKLIKRSKKLIKSAAFIFHAICIHNMLSYRNK